MGSRERWSSGPYRREPAYAGIELPPDPFVLFSNERYGWMRSSLDLLTLNLSLSLSRQYFSDKLWGLYNHPDEIKTVSGFDDEDIKAHITYLEATLTMFGLCLKRELTTMEPTDGRKGRTLNIIDPSAKYLSYEELRELAKVWRDQGKMIGIIQGCFDPQHIGHSQLAAETYPYCDVLVCGFNKNSQIRLAKGEDRPRYPQLAWRMWEMASTPVIDFVFVMPTKEYDSDEYTDMYRELGIKLMGAGHDNLFLPVYEERMRRLGGKVMVSGRPNHPSSTEIVQTLVDKAIASAHLPRVILQGQIEMVDRMAKRAGYLRDYPQGT